MSSVATSEPLYRIPSQIKKKPPPLSGTTEPEKVYPKPSQEDLEAFKGQLDEWVRMEDQLRKLNVARRECMLRMKRLGAGVEEFMTKYGYEHINRRDGSHIKYRTREVKQPMTLQTIKTQLLALDEAELRESTPMTLLERLFNNAQRGTVVRTTLRRFVPTLPTHLEV
jgi:hypothetical protein